jgi:hypothetical protein
VKIGSKVRVENSNSSWWGEVGTVVYIHTGCSFDTVGVNVEPNPEEGQHVVEFSENELEEYETRR